jgi:formamidopyrimidine-DNA glycosylase
MPELPEVETVVRDLRPLLVGSSIASVKAGPRQLRTRWSKAWGRRVAGCRVKTIRRRGKWILVDLAPEGVLVLHLGMTGQLTVVPHDRTGVDHVHLVFRLDNGERELQFRDVRRFGSATLYADENAWTESLGTPLGPEPFEMERLSWRQALARTDRCMKAVLLDQRVVAGVGNIYADESLFLARIHPEQTASTLTAARAERLRRAIQETLRRAIAGRGSTIRDYVGGSGLNGAYQDALAVYGRTGEPCIRCRTTIERIRLAGRSTHFCPKCQRWSSI